MQLSLSYWLGNELENNLATSSPGCISLMYRKSYAFRLTHMVMSSAWIGLRLPLAGWGAGATWLSVSVLDVLLEEKATVEQWLLYKLDQNLLRTLFEHGGME